MRGLNAARDARPLVLALLALALAAPSANAALGDGYIPDSETLPGVTRVTLKHGELGLRFGPKADGVLKTIAGKRARMACAFLEDDDGWLNLSAGAQETDTVPRGRRTVSLGHHPGTNDLCAIATKRGKAERGPCAQLSGTRSYCIRVIVPLTDKARTYLDQKKRAIALFVLFTAHAFLETEGRLDELPKAFGADAVALPAPDAAPPAGKVGYYDGPEMDLVTSALLASGERVYLSFQNGAYSTNVPDLVGPREDAFELL